MLVLPLQLVQKGTSHLLCLSLCSSAASPLPHASSLSSPSQCYTDFRAALSSPSKGDGWTALLRARLTASPFSLAREKQLLEGESIFISPQADGSRIDIKGDSARGKGMGLRGARLGRGGRANQIQEQRAEQKEIERS